MTHLDRFTRQSIQYLRPLGVLASFLVSVTLVVVLYFLHLIPVLVIFDNDIEAPQIYLPKMIPALTLLGVFFLPLLLGSALIHWKWLKHERRMD